MDKFYFGVVMKKVTDVGAEFGRYELEPGVFEQFLLADSGEGDDERILIFGRESFGGLFTNFIFNQNNSIFP